MSAEKTDMPPDGQPMIPEGAPPAYSQVAPGYGYNQQPQAGYAPVHPGGYAPPPQGQQYYATAPGQPMYQPGAPGVNVQYVVAPVPQNMSNEPPPPDYFNKAIFVTLCCFWPTGILAIMKASDARSAIARGDMVTARNSAQSARQMINISIIVGILSIVVACVLIGVYVGVIASSTSSYYD